VSVYRGTSKLNDECFVRVHAIGTKMKYFWKKGKSDSERQPHDITSCKLVILILRKKTKRELTSEFHTGCLGRILCIWM
jgi:hypothetical protein